MASEGSQLPSLSVVVPTYNEAGWLPATLLHLRTAIAMSPWGDVEIIVVDDGSTDATPEVLAMDRGTPPLTVLRQENRGRLLARRRGLRAASGEMVLLLDSRVFADARSLEYLADQLATHPGELLWNGHCVTKKTTAPWSRFWDAVAYMAWHRYLSNPRKASFGIDEFDHYPKGTGFFVAPRDWLLEASDAVIATTPDPRFASDDTMLFRSLLHHGDITISPSFACTYFPRTSLRQFLEHAYHRGSTFTDGHLRSGHRFFAPTLTLAVAAIPIAVWTSKRPRRLLAVGFGGSTTLAVAALAAGTPPADAASLGLLSVPFGVAYGSGIVRGLLLRYASRSRRWPARNAAVGSAAQSASGEAKLEQKGSPT